MKFISSLINGVASIILSIVVANYGIEEFYRYIKKEAIEKVRIGLPSLSTMTNQLTCKQLNDKMELVSYNKG